MNTARIPQWFDAMIVRNHVAELDDFRHTAEMLDEARSTAEGLPREVVDGDLAIVQIGIWNAGQVLENEILNDAKILTDGGRTHLLVIADNQHGLAEIERHQGHYV